MAPTVFDPALFVEGIHIAVVRAYIRARLGRDLNLDAVHPNTSPRMLATALDYVAAKRFPADPVTCDLVFKLQS